MMKIECNPNWYKIRDSGDFGKKFEKMIAQIVAEWGDHFSFTVYPEPEGNSVVISLHPILSGRQWGVDVRKYIGEKMESSNFFNFPNKLAAARELAVKALFFAGE